MKKYRDDDYWFELTEGLGPDGFGFVRYFRVSCRKCGRQAKHLASGQSNEQLRKFFIHQNWNIGRATNLHFCPDCANKNKRPLGSKHKPTNVIPFSTTSRITLQDAWMRASKKERTAFLILLRQNYPEITTQSEPYPPPEPPSEAPPGTVDDFLRKVKEQANPQPVDDGWQHGSHINSLPVEPEPPPIENPPATIPDEEEDDGDVADWWLDLQNHNATQQGER